jgi:hypothetical protein
MSKLLIPLLMCFILSCGNKENESMNKVATKFSVERHDPNLDQQIQPLLNQYFAVMAHLQTQDSADLVLYGTNMIMLADSLSQQELSLDTATKHAAIQGLTNIQYEMSAILMESSPTERIVGAQMLSLQWIHFLAAIGYQKQTIYIFSDSDEAHWMGLKNKSSNPYISRRDEVYTAVQVLQEL